MRTWTAANSLQLKKLLRAFRACGATTSRAAVTIDELGWRQNKVFRYLCEDGVIIAVDGQRYYLDESQAQLWVARFRRRAIKIGVLLLVAFLIFLIAALWRS